MGGGYNHRFGLYDAVLIKDNHIAVAGGIKEAVTAVRRRIGHTTKIEVEVETLEQLCEALELSLIHICSSEGGTGFRPDAGY